MTDRPGDRQEATVPPEPGWPAVAEHTHVYDHETASNPDPTGRILVTEWCVCGCVIQQYFDTRDYE